MSQGKSAENLSVRDDFLAINKTDEKKGSLTREKLTNVISLAEWNMLEEAG